MAVQESPDHGAARVVGIVRGDAGEPVPGVRVVDARSGRWALTDTAGRFSIGPLDAGRRKIELRRLGYRTAQLNVLAAQPADTVRVVLARVPAVLEPVRTVGSRDGTGFAERRERGRGYFITREELARRGAVEFADIFRGVPGARLVRVTSSLRDTDFVLQFDRSSDAYGGNCPVSFYVDGTQVGMGWAAVSWQLRPRDIEAMEIYQGTQVPPQFLGRSARCGVVVIWTTQAAVPPDSTRH